VYVTFRLATPQFVVPGILKLGIGVNSGRYHKLTRDKLTASFAFIVFWEDVMKRNFTVIALLLVCFNAHAGLNKWVDAEGKVHYSDTPPPEVTTQNVRNIAGKEQTDAPASYSPKSIAEREAEYRKAKQEKTEASQKNAKQAANAEIRKTNCAAARRNARTLEAGTRVVTYDANGERTYLDDQARTQRLEEAQQAISDNCD
jgi:hypothetical protein